MDFVRQLKEQINIADVVGEYVRLRKTGSNYMGLCPFHAERSPSFSVTEKRKIFHCFGCLKSGDVIAFIQEIQGVSFHDAIRLLASKFNMKLPVEFQARGAAADSRPSNEDKLEIYYKLNRFVAQFYHEKLLGPAGKVAREYLEARGVSEATIKNAYLGYAPNDWAELYDFLVVKQAPLDKAEELGLIRRKERGSDASGRAHYDLFRDRVMFPVTDLRGRVIAFGGRAIGESDGPKYLNSSESPVYKKGSHLFGIFYAQKEIRAEDLCVVVEGFMDCLALQQNGIGFAIATLGTALTERQVGMLKRFTRNIVLLFDGDSAGRDAQLRAMETFLNEDVVVRGVTLPDELDPDEFVRERGAETLLSMLRNAPFLLDQRVLELAAQAGTHAEARARVVDQALPWVAKVSSDTARVVRLQELSSLFDIKIELLEKRMSELRSALPKSNARPAAAARHASPFPSSKDGKPATARMPGRPIARGTVAASQEMSLDALDSKLIEHLVMHGMMLSQLVSQREEVLCGLETEAARALASRLFESVGEQLGCSALEWTDNVALKTVVSRAFILAEQEQAALRTPEQQQDTVHEIQDLIKKLTRRGRERRKDQLRANILKAEGSGQTMELSRLMSEYRELVKCLDESKSAGRDASSPVHVKEVIS